MARKKSKLKVSLPKELEKESLEPRDVKKLFEKLFTEVQLKIILAVVLFFLFFRFFKIEVWI